MNQPERRRCAVYTRKSTEEGLDQDFNSLAAQRAACEAFVASQAGEGWRLVKTAYDDGGFSGGTMERPALQALLCDVTAGLVDVIVVYKVDRLTRSLMDFARIVERLDAKGASFVSVTQAFNTTTSMGRLTLNVLLSFAQFEREITGERIRDKIALSKKRGLWMGGRCPLGYEPHDRVLKIAPEEAAVVRGMFERYLELGSIRLLSEELRARGVTSKRITTRDGRQLGGATLWTGPVRYILTNRTYLGEIRHRAVWYPGQHEPIVAPDLFAAVEAKLAEGRAGPRRALRAEKRPLIGLAFDDAGNPLTPSHTVQRQGRRYDYYVSHALISGGGATAGSLPRVSAPLLESQVRDVCVRVLGLPPGWAGLRVALQRVDVSKSEIAITVRADATRNDTDYDAMLARLGPGETLQRDADDLTLTAPIRARPWRGRKGGMTARGAPLTAQRHDDLSLLTAIVLAHAWRKEWASGALGVSEIATREGVDRTHVARLMRLAYLAPDITRRVLQGDPMPALTVGDLLSREMPLSWSEQRAQFLA